MGELFRRSRPQEALEWTGERLVSSVQGVIESEHLHRYFLGRSLCRGKRVLDIASGEGYGSALLAQTAQQVIGVELDRQAVEHASQSYQRPGLRFLQGSTTAIPLPDHSVDVVVSFETLEHFSDHENFYREVRRVLIPNGLLVISTPDVDVYSAPGTSPNPYHVRELSRAEFQGGLQAEFKTVSLFAQRALSGSAIVAECLACVANSEPIVYEQRDPDTFETHHHLPRAPYLIAFASDGPLPTIPLSVYAQEGVPGAIPADLQQELQRLQAVEAAVSQHSSYVAQRESEFAQREAEFARRDLGLARHERELAERDQVVELKAQAELAAAKAESQRLVEELGEFRTQRRTYERAAAELQQTRSELEGLQRDRALAEMTARQQTLVAQRLQFNFGKQLQTLQDKLATVEEEARVLRQHAEGATKSAISLSGQVVSVEDLARALEEQSEALGRADESIESMQGDINRLREQLEQKTDSLTAAHQSINDMRAEYDHHLEVVRAQLQHEREMTERVARLLVPVWMRRLVPSGVRSAGRSVKQALRTQARAN